MIEVVGLSVSGLKLFSLARDNIRSGMFFPVRNQFVQESRASETKDGELSDVSES